MNTHAPTATLFLHFTFKTTVVRRLDEQIFLCIEDESLSPAQQSELLAWVHDHLLSAYVASYLDARHNRAAKSAAKHRISSCDSVIETIRHMIYGGMPVGEDGTFECPPSCCSCAQALSGRLPGWVHGRIVFAAQRTRWHTEAELAALWETVEAHLLTAAIAAYGLSELLDVDVPARKRIDTPTLGCLEATCGARGLSWAPTGAAVS